MTVRENIVEGLNSIKSNGLRALITALIIAIGIAALVGILTSIDGMKSAVSKTFSTMGAQSFMIRESAGIQRMGGRREVIHREPISYKTAVAFRNELKFPATVSLSQPAGMALKVRSGNVETNPNCGLTGVDENYLLNSGFDIGKGRNFSRNDIDMALPLAIVGYEVATKLFGKSSAVGQEIFIGGHRYRVVGQLESKGSTMGNTGSDRSVFIPVTRAEMDSRIQSNTDIDVFVNDMRDLDPAMDEAYFTMRRLRGLRVNEPDNFILSKSDALANEALDSLGMVTTLGSVIAFITLLGAAISLMNIMLVSVTERTREIGLRKSLGASSKQIRNQFLTEAVVICQLGGIGGMLLGLLLGNLVAFGLKVGFIVPWNWMLLSVLLCTIVGLAAGIYPAKRAAGLDPVEALRHE